MNINKITHSKLCGTRVDRWISELNEDQGKEALELVDRLLMMWDEWRYAWDMKK